MARRLHFNEIAGIDTKRVANIPEVQLSTGSAETARQSVEHFQNLSRNINKALDDKVIQAAETAGIEAGQAQNFKVLNDDTLAAKSFNRAGLSTYLTTIETNTRRRFDELFAENQNDPEGLKSALDGYRTGIMEQLKLDAPQIVPAFEEIYDRHSRPMIKEAQKNNMKIKRDEAVASTMNAIELNVNAAERLARIEDSDTRAALALSGERESYILKLLEHGPDASFKFEGHVMEADPTRLSAFSLEEIQRLVEDFDDRVAMSRIIGKFDRASDKEKFLDRFSDDSLTNLSSVLSLDQIERAKAHMRSEINRRRVEQNARRAALKDQIDDAVFVMERGRIPPGYETLRRAAGEFPELQASLDTAYHQKEIAAEYSKLTPAEQQIELSKISGRLAQTDTASRETIELKERLEKIHSDTVEGLKNDPVAYVAETGQVTLNTLDPADLESYATRRQAVQMLRSQYGIESHGLTSDEISSLENHLDAADSAGKLTLLSGLRSQMFDYQFSSLMNEVAKTQPVYALAASIAPEAPKISHEMIRGQKLLEDPQMSKFLPSKTDYQGALAGEVGDAFKHDAQALGQVIQAALGIDLLRRNNRGDLDNFDEGDFEDILHEVTGGLIEYNDHKIIPPIRGMTENSFEKAMDELTDDQLIDAFGNRPTMPNGEPVTADMLRRHGWLENIGQGLYLININGFYAQGVIGEPFEFNFNKP